MAWDPDTQVRPNGAVLTDAERLLYGYTWERAERFHDAHAEDAELDEQGRCIDCYRWAVALARIPPSERLPPPEAAQKETK